MTSLRSKIGAAVVFLFIFSAQADAAVAPAPVGDWVVGPINAVSSTGKSYCSMRNVYPNGVSIVFARDSAGANSIAFDFHSKDLSPGSEYPLFLKIDRLSRSRTAVAATDSVLIVQMGDDDHFYNALSSKDALDIQSNKKIFSFGLHGTSKAFERLDDCAAALGGGVEMPHVKVSSEGMLPAAFDDIFDAPIATQQRPARAYVNVTKVDADKAFDIAAQARRDVELSRVEALELEKRALEARLAEAERRDIFNEPPPRNARLIEDVLMSAHLIDKELDGDRYHWNAKGVAGQAREVRLQKGQSLQDVLDGVIASKTSSCDKEFAYTTAVRGDAVFSEAACIDAKGKGTVEAMLIKSDQAAGNAVIISYRAASDKAEQAISERDRMARYADGR